MVILSTGLQTAQQLGFEMRNALLNVCKVRTLRIYRMLKHCTTYMHCMLDLSRGREAADEAA